MTERIYLFLLAWIFTSELKMKRTIHLSAIN